jgi:hypothetical protein
MADLISLAPPLLRLPLDSRPLMSDAAGLSGRAVRGSVRGTAVFAVRMQTRTRTLLGPFAYR